MLDLDAGAGVDVGVDFDADIDAVVYADADAELSHQATIRSSMLGAKWSSPLCEASQLFNYFVCKLIRI